MFLGSDTDYRVRLELTRGKVVDHDDSPMMQTVSFRGLQNELLTAERFQSYGRSVVPVAPDDSAGLRAPEMLVGFVGGDRSHPVVFAMDDRRYRPKSGKPGQVDDYHYKGHGATWGDTGWSYSGGASKLSASWTVGDLTVTWTKDDATIQFGGKGGPTVHVAKGGVYLGGKPSDGGSFLPVQLVGGVAKNVYGLQG